MILLLLDFTISGVSGGEEGARHGPSLMPGGPYSAYQRIEPILKKIAAQVDDGPCVTYIGYVTIYMLVMFRCSSLFFVVDHHNMITVCDGDIYLHTLTSHNSNNDLQPWWCW